MEDDTTSSGWRSTRRRARRDQPMPQGPRPVETVPVETGYAHMPTEIQLYVSRMMDIPDVLSVYNAGLTNVITPSVALADLEGRVDHINTTQEYWNVVTLVQLLQRTGSPELRELWQKAVRELLALGEGVPIESPHQFWQAVDAAVQLHDDVRPLANMFADMVVRAAETLHVVVPTDIMNAIFDGRQLNLSGWQNSIFKNAHNFLVMFQDKVEMLPRGMQFVPRNMLLPQTEYTDASDQRAFVVFPQAMPQIRSFIGNLRSAHEVMLEATGIAWNLPESFVSVMETILLSGALLDTDLAFLRLRPAELDGLSIADVLIEIMPNFMTANFYFHLIWDEVVAADMLADNTRRLLWQMGNAEGIPANTAQSIIDYIGATPNVHAPVLPSWAERHGIDANRTIWGDHSEEEDWEEE